MPSTRSERSERPNISEQILEHAARLFAARGFVGASLHDIAKAVGIRKPSLLYHFRSKDELRKGVLEQMLAHWNETVPRILRAATSGEEQFEAIAHETIAFFCARPDRARLILRELLDRSDEVGPLVELHVQPWARMICDYIRRGQQQGRIRQDVDPEAYVAQAIASVLAAVSIHASLTVLLDGLNGSEHAHDGSPPKRLIQEMMRVAQASLFVTQPMSTNTHEPDEG